ncbi:MAG: AAA family ATPase, partial [Clostridia bacterium]|nr:AAA family ATPase [Clostridia bacterium]
LICNPARTNLLLQAEKLGMEALDGLPFLVEQARKSAEIFTGHSISIEESKHVLRRVRTHAMNIALIGMPGCGKSTVGRALAKLLDRPFIDLDEELVKQTGKDIPTIFAKEGESGFRARETDVLNEFSKESGLVLATGGGVVTRPENRDLLRRNSRIIRLTRPLEELAVEGRPIFLTNSLPALARERETLYQTWAEASVPVTDPEKTAEKIKALLCGLT